jgi:RHS repeat-associated protein
MQSNREMLHINDPLDQPTTTLLAIDQQCTVLSALTATRPHTLSYTPYGYRFTQWGLPSWLGFNGKQPDPVTGHYLLGNGYRAFNPVLMRFNSPDSWCPFGRGGVNPYAYCMGDPVNRGDPTGHTPVWLKDILRSRGLMRARPQQTSSVIFRAEGPFRNPLARSLPPQPNSKTPAWTTQENLPFAGTESRHPGAPRSATSQESLTSLQSNTPDVQPLPHTRHTGNVLEQLGLLYALVQFSNFTSDSRSPLNNLGLAFDPPPPYSAPLPPPKYDRKALPSYQQALVNQRWQTELSKRQGSVIRGSI